MKPRLQPTAVLEQIARLRRAFERAVYQLRTEAGMCPKLTCPRMAEPPGRFCARHRAARNRVWKDLSRIQVEAGLCSQPGCPNKPFKKHKQCEAHYLKSRTYRKKGPPS